MNTISEKERIEGYIAFFNLQDWWLSTFAREEREYIDNRYQPMGLPHHILTKGKWETSKPATQFLNELNTWFKAKKDTLIADRIHAKIIELGIQQPIQKHGYYQGRHYTTYVRDVEYLRKSKKLEEAEELLLKLIEATEAENTIDNNGVAPWYYEQLANIYRKQKNYAKEIAALERFEKQKHAPGKKSLLLLKRLKGS